MATKDPYNDPKYRKIMDKEVYPNAGNGVTPQFQASVDRAQAAFNDAERRGSGGGGAGGGELLASICLTAIVTAIAGVISSGARRLR